MTYLPTEEDLALLKSRSKRLYCRIELLNKDYQIIDTIEGLALSGSNSIDADSDTRRTFNLDIFPKSGFSISQFSTEEWTSKMLRLQIGMKAPTSMPLVGADAVRIPEEEIDAKIKNSAIYKEKDTELRQAKWRYKVGGYEQYGNIENINRKRIIWTDENKEKYASFVKEQGDIGTYSTVVASSDGYTTNGKTYEIAYTPLLIGGGDVVIPLLNADIRSYIEVIFNAACDAVQRDGSTLQSKILELDSFGVDCTIYGKTIRVKNMIAAVEGGIAAGRILSAADVAAIAGCTKEELDKYFHDTSVFVGYSMHDIQGTIWELKDGLTQIYNFYHALYSGEAEIRTGTNFVDTDGVHWYGAGVYAIQQNGYSYDATTNKLTPTNTTYSDATQSAHGLMSTADKKKLDGFGAASTYALKSDITAMYRYKGSVTSTDKLPTSGQTIGDVYDVGNGMNYAWNGSAWDALGEIFTITKITNTEIDTVLAS